jgi:hypothetical protein
MDGRQQLVDQYFSMLASTFDTVDLHLLNSTNTSFSAQGISATAAANTTTNIDFKLNDDCFLWGGKFSCVGAVFGDTCSLQVVDVDGVYTPAGTVINNPVINWPMSGVDGLQFDLTVGHCPKKMPGNLYLRAIYTSTGSTPVKIAIGYCIFKILM